MRKRDRDAPVKSNPNAAFRYDRHHLFAKGDPALFLREFLKMSYDPTRGQIAFDHNDLDWISQAWEAAALAAVGESTIRDACLHERDRYRKLCRDLKDGEHERKDAGVVFLDSPSDWPHPVALYRAICALESAGIELVA